MKKSEKKAAAKAPDTPALVLPPPPQAQTQVPLIYADAIGNLLMSPITTRLTLTLNAGPVKDGVQPAVAAMEVVIPTPALLAFSKRLSELLRDRGSELAKAYENAGKQMAEFAPQSDK